MDGSKNYKLHVPANVPVHQYWSLTLYDFETHGLIRDVDYASRSSLTSGLQTNTDGSVDLYMGPEAPKGKNSIGYPQRLVDVLKVFFVCMARINPCLIENGCYRISKK